VNEYQRKARNERQVEYFLTVLRFAENFKMCQNLVARDDKSRCKSLWSRFQVGECSNSSKPSGCFFFPYCQNPCHLTFMGLNLVPRRSGSFSTARQGLRRAHGTAAPGSATTAESGDGGCWGEKWLGGCRNH
jgi:hypothetical protein